MSYSRVLDLLAIPLSWLALPVILVWLYDKFVLAPHRPKRANGEAEPGPTYTRVAGWLLPFVIIAVIRRVGVSEVFALAREIAGPLSWAAIPVGLWCAFDSWILAPRRQIAAGALAVQDPPLLRVAYAVLPVLVIAVIVRMISAERLDFSLVLLLLSIATGLVWAADTLLFRKKRELALAKGVGGELALPEPGTVDYARSFFPVAFIVLVVRAFIFEPFRIPSDSMMPTLLDGDFIVVNKYAYGLRLPIVNRKFIDTGTPQRGDVVVFRHPPDPSTNYIKRLVGLPGDRVEIHDDHHRHQRRDRRAPGRRSLHRWLLCRPQAVDGNPRRTHAPGHVVPRAPGADAGATFQLLGKSGTAAGLRPQDHHESDRRLGLRRVGHGSRATIVAITFSRSCRRGTTS